MGEALSAPGTTFTGIPLDEDYCKWRVDNYPSTQMELAYHDNTPAIYAGIVAAIFIFTALLVLIYDWMVEKRQRHLEYEAKKSNAIVSSLFPDVVRNRLFGNDTKKNVKQFMTDTSIAFDKSRELNTKPIADLFPDCTVMFGDIAGFTAWSSAREPSQVFILLETIYGAFDKMAKQQKVFKVETIGDYYLAVTGLPDPQKDHAIRSKYDGFNVSSFFISSSNTISTISISSG